MLPGSFRYMPGHFGDGLEQIQSMEIMYLLTYLGDMHPDTRCTPSIHLGTQCGRVAGITVRGYVSMLGKT